MTTLRRYAAVLALSLLGSAGAANTLPSSLQALTQARREIIAVLPTVGSEAFAQALKGAASKGTRVFLITERATVKRGGYLLTVSHGPPSIRTYLYPGRITQPWVIVDGAWGLAGPGLDQSAGGDLQVFQDSATLKRLNAWAQQVTKAGPTARPDLLKLRYGK